MKVTLTEVGGWANLRRSCTLDTASLSRPLRRKLELNCRSALSAKVELADASVRDSCTVTLVVEIDGTQMSASFVEPGAPPELRPVLEVMRPLCRPGR